ncbi:MAG: polymerase subunit sigma-24 [Ramlibacter sp.]|nr:polymerase subunit sigma-24 [Ramlibacter sp.]
MKGLESDVELVERSSAGDRKAFESLVIRYQGPIYNAAFRITGNEQDACDVSQMVFMKVAERLDEYDRNRKFFSWIFRISVNEAINFVQRRRPEDPLEDDDSCGPERDEPEARYVQRQISERIQRALLKLKPDDRTVITLRHFSECSYQEMAEILVLEEKTVRSRLYEARQRLAGLLMDLQVR